MLERFSPSTSVINTLLNSIKQGEKLTVFGCDLDAKLTLLKESGKSVFFVTNDIKDAVTVKEKLAESGFRVALLMDKLNFKLSPFEADNNRQVIETLSKVLMGEIDALIVNPMYLVYYLPKVSWIRDNTLNLHVGDTLDIEDLKKKLVDLGFSRADVPNSKQYCVKGDMVDICTFEKSVRIYFDFDTIREIKTYDKETLINQESLEDFYITPTNWLEGLPEEFSGLKEEVLDTLNTYKSKLNNMLWCMQFANNIGCSILDYLDDNWIIAINDNKVITNYLNDEIKIYNDTIKEEFDNSDDFIVKNIVFNNLPLIGFQYITSQNRLFNSTRVFNLKSIPVLNYISNHKLLSIDLSQNLLKNYTSIIYTADKDGLTKISDLLSVNKIAFNVVNLPSQAVKGQVNLIAKRNGINANFELEKIFVLSNLNLFGKVKKKIKNVKTESFSGFLPEAGDYVVHATHGIGVCKGVECLKLSTAKRDYVIIEYKNADRLYLPVENIDLIDKYVGEPNPSLNRLGGTEFLKTKEKVRSTVKKLAFNLALVYAERSKAKGYTYPKDDELMLEFENSFGYEETADQMQAIEDIKADMISGKVMDRLICGDVGFGKTEVALRAAFKTIISGKQVAFLCPTTILSQQHYNTAIFRMKNFGVNIAVLNRFCTTKELQKIYTQLKSGEIDMIVGTHKLLNKDVEFKNLGLLILDEEQKFGVGDKEKIKNLKKNVNVLTLSATPIPRTLNMSLVGIRDISVIETPPVSRIPTAVKVSEYSDELLTQAIDFELNRDGQVLIVFNRVESIYEFANHVKNLYPDVSVDVAHGQMKQEKLEEAIFKLYNKDTQILISTTLIENGIDLPNANTLIVINADMLGLSQLYQLKGRVGRSDRQAFAYFTFDGGRILSDTAVKRLEAITEYTSMGSGFKIALKDLEIRGAGDIFGAEQSGHIEKVGYAMYVKLLNEALKEIKGGEVSVKSEIRVETSLNAFIPNDYISDYNQRMSTYLKISKIDNSSKLTQVLNELTEVYGEPTSEIINLCKIALIKNLAEKIGVERVVLKPRQSQLINVSLTDNVYKAMSQFSKNLVLENKTLPIIMVDLSIDLAQSVDLLINFLEFVVN